MSISKFAPNTRETSPEIQQRVWRQHGYVAVWIDDPDMPWDLREMLISFMTRQHGISPVVVKERKQCAMGSVSRR